MSLKKQNSRYQLQRLFRASLSILFLNNVGLVVAFPLFTPLVLKPIYPTLPLSYSLPLRTILLGILIASFPLAQLLGGPFMQWLEARKGQKFVFSFSLVGEALGFFFTGIALHFFDYPFLLCSRFWTGFFAGNFANCLSLIAKTDSTPQTRTSHFQIITKTTGISFVTAIIIGGTLSNERFGKIFSSAFPFWLISFFTFAYVFHIQKVFSQKGLGQKNIQYYFHHQFSGVAAIFKTPKIMLHYLVFFFLTLGWIMVLQFIPTFLIEQFEASKQWIVLTFLTTGMGWYISNGWFVPLLEKRFNASYILFYSLLLTSLSLVSATLSAFFCLFLLFLFFVSVFAAISWNHSLTFLSLNAPEEFQHKLLGINQVVAILAMACAPLIGGFLGAHFIRFTYFFSSFSIFLSFCIFSFLLKNKTI